VLVRSFFNIDGFLAEVRGIFDKNLVGVDPMTAEHAGIDSRFDIGSSLPGFTRGDVYRLVEQQIARVNSSIEGWSERAYESAEYPPSSEQACETRTARQ
jgi:hypothetical protein